MLIFELLRAEIAERGVQSACVVDLIDEARKVGRDVLEGLVGHRIDGLDLECLHEALCLGVIIGIAAAPHRSDEAMFGECLPVASSRVLGGFTGSVTNIDGTGFAGPKVIWKKRRAVLRQSRRWSTAWSPEQIAHRLRIDYPEDSTMRISHEAIYQSLYIQGRGALRRELTACLRSGRALRVPRERTRGRGKSFVGDAVMISERPPEVEDRAIPGHWEGDLILGLHSSAIGTLVERSSRFTMLLHLPRQEGYQRGQGVKNGPPRAGHGAEAVRTAIVQSMSELPKTLRQSLTWDQGAEMAQHARLRIESGLEIYFCDPQSPWQRGSNENTNGLLRQYFPKGTDLSRHSTGELAAVAHAMNTRPRRTHGWKTPIEVLDHFLAQQYDVGVATIG